MRRKNVTRQMIKDYISQALLHLMQKKAYSQITIQEITLEAGVNRSTYYRNFTSKETIIQYIFGEIIDKFDAYAGEPLELSLPSCLPEMFHHFYKYQKTFLIIHKAGLSHLLLNAFNDYFKKVYGSEDAQQLYAVYYHTGGIFNTFLLWLDQEMKIPPDDMAQIALTYLLKNGIFDRQGREAERTV